MFDNTSRYAKLPTTTVTDSTGRLVTYVQRRFLPAGDSHRVLVEVSVTAGDRLDLIAHRTLGNAEQYWRICDANDALDPFELTEDPGRVLLVPLPRV